MTGPSRRRALTAVLLLVAFIALAGCSAVSDGQTRSPLDVDQSEYTAREALANGSIVAFDPDREHAPRPGLLVDATTSRLGNRSHTVLVTFTAETDDGERIEAREIRLEQAQNQSIYMQQLRFVTQDEHRTVRQYANGETVWERTDENDSATGQLVTNELGEQVDPAVVRVDLVEMWVLDGLYGTNLTDVTEVEAPDSDVDGRVYRLTRDGPTSNPSDFEDRSVTMTVTADGRILAYEHEASYVNRSGTVVTLQTTVEIVDVGTTDVEVPEWVPANASERQRQASATPTVPRRSGGSSANIVRSTRSDLLPVRLQRTRLVWNHRTNFV